MAESTDKVVEIFRRLAGEKAERLRGEFFPADVCTKIAFALAEGNLEKVVETDKPAFHLIDWQRGAAFIVALTLFPEEFSDDEIREEVQMLLCDMPAHILEAARLLDYPTENIFRKNSNDSAS